MPNDFPNKRQFRFLILPVPFLPTELSAFPTKFFAVEEPEDEMAVLPPADDKTGAGVAEQADSTKAQTDRAQQGEQTEAEDATADQAPAKPSVPQAAAAVQKDADTSDTGQAGMAQPLRAAGNATSTQQVQDAAQTADAEPTVATQPATSTDPFAQEDSAHVWHVNYSETAAAAARVEQQADSAQTLLAAVADSAESQPLDEIAGCCCYYCSANSGDGGSDGLYGDAATQVNPAPGNSLIAGIAGPNKWNESSTPSLTWAMSNGSTTEWDH